MTNAYSRIEDMLHVHGLLFDIWLKGRGYDTESREAGVLGSELWKNIVNVSKPADVGAPTASEEPTLPPHQCHLCDWLPRIEGENDYRYLAIRGYRSGELNSEDRAEIRENFIRVGSHTDDGRCYCPKCIDRRNQPRKSFERRMIRHGFKNDGLPLDPGVRALWTRDYSLDLNKFSHRWQNSIPLFEEEFGITNADAKGSGFKPDFDYVKWTIPVNQNDTQTVNSGEPILLHDGVHRLGTWWDSPAWGLPVEDCAATNVNADTWPIERGGTPSPSTGRLGRYGLGYLKLSARRSATSLSDLYATFKTNVWLPPVPTPHHESEYLGSCQCPKTTGLKLNGERRTPHEADVFVYADGSTRVECPYVDKRYGAECAYVSAWKFEYEPHESAYEVSARFNKNWKRDWQRAKNNDEIPVHPIYEKRSRVSTSDLDNSGGSADINVDENGDETNIGTPAAAHGLDWVEDGTTRKSKDSKFKIDAETLLELAKRFYGVDLRYVTHEELKRDPHFSNIAWAYTIRTRYLDGCKITDSEKRKIHREVETMKAILDGRCRDKTCPNNRCADPTLTLAERREVHALNALKNFPKDWVGRWYCVVNLDRPRAKFLPDVSQFAGATEEERVEAAFAALVADEMDAAEKLARKNGDNPKKARLDRKAVFSGRVELLKLLPDEDD